MFKPFPSVPASIYCTTFSQLETTLIVFPPPPPPFIYLLTYFFTDERTFHALIFSQADWQRRLTDWTLANLGKILGLEIEGKAANYLWLHFAFLSTYLFYLKSWKRPKRVVSVRFMYCILSYSQEFYFFKWKIWRITTLAALELEELKETQEGCLSPLYVPHSFLFPRILFLC